MVTRPEIVFHYSEDAGIEIFEPHVPATNPDAEGQWIATRAVRPTATRPLDDLVAEQERAGVDLRFVDALTPVRAEVVGSGLPFSIVRWTPDP